MLIRFSLFGIALILIGNGCATAFDAKEGSPLPLDTDDSNQEIDQDSDLKPDSGTEQDPQDEQNGDACPEDPGKSKPGACGCGIEDIDSDGDLTPDCIDQCSHDANKIDPGVCGCGTPDPEGGDNGPFDCIDDCDPDPCVNGICADDGSSYSCHCDEGWSGVNCNNNIDDCDPDACVNGKCADGLNSYSCSCDHGWTGKNCDKETDGCDFDPCVHGTCVDGVGHYSCECSSGWTGANCDLNIDDCDPEPCAHGTCLDGLNSYSCSCDAGWTDTNCTEDIDECTPKPCLHGQCTDGVNSYSCDCEAGWTGTKCNQNIDDCSPDPCINGTCVDEVNSYSCDCEAGWTGAQCNQNIDDCNPNPCVHGTCIDEIDSYKCQCDAGWNGNNCDMEESCPIGIELTSNTVFTDPVESQSPTVHEYHDSCDAGQVIVGYHGFLRDEYGKNLVQGKIQALCATPFIISLNNECVMEIGTSTALPLRGNIGNREWTRMCPAGEVIVGYSGKAGMDIDQITFVCAPLLISTSSSGHTIARGDSSTLEQAGGDGGNYNYEDSCPSGRVPTSSIVNSSNILITAVGLGCQSPSLVY